MTTACPSTTPAPRDRHARRGRPRTCAAAGRARRRRPRPARAGPRRLAAAVGAVRPAGARRGAGADGCREHAARPGRGRRDGRRPARRSRPPAAGARVRPALGSRPCGSSADEVRERIAGRREVAAWVVDQLPTRLDEAVAHAGPAVVVIAVRRGRTRDRRRRLGGPDPGRLGRGRRRSTRRPVASASCGSSSRGRRSVRPDLDRAGIESWEAVSTFHDDPADQVVPAVDRLRDDEIDVPLSARLGDRDPARPARRRGSGRGRVLHRALGLGQVDDRPCARRRARGRGAPPRDPARRRRGPPAPVARSRVRRGVPRDQRRPDRVGRARWSPPTAGSPSRRRSRRSPPGAGTPARSPSGMAPSCSSGSARRSTCARRATGRASTPRPCRRGRRLHRHLVALRGARRRRRRDRHGSLSTFPRRVLYRDSTPPEPTGRVRSSGR